MTEPRDAYLLIAGERLGVEGRETLDICNPATAGVIGALPIATASDLDAALAAAKRGFAAWRQVTPFERSKVIKGAARLLRERAASIAPIMTREQGKLVREAEGELLGTAETLEWHAEEARRVYGRVVATPVPGGRGLVTREPVGPVAAFSPWNFPALMPGRKMAAAIAAGCSIIIKPAEETPFTALAIAEIFLEAGLPPDVLSVVFGKPAEISTRLVTAEEIRKVSFTGSVTVGRQIAHLAAEGVKRLTMELGGHAPTLVFEDADLDAALQFIGRSKFGNAGQTCVSATRFYVHESLHDRFVDGLAALASGLKIGAGDDPASGMGPMANSRRLEAMERLTDDALAHGARLAAGGRRHGNEGWFWQPTVLADVPETARIMNDEPFGPVAVTSRFASEDEAIAAANRLPFGLAAYAFTRDLARATRLQTRLEAGLVGINTTMIAFPETPFGGVKDSGYGSEGGAEALDAYLTTKFVHQI
ncbi:MAG: NAD-dependent succinate-semialdehyde dehydrogenase [Devosia sp.]|nr:NAD-dependent succinate-semialdehyde dehydrogenase [Devosia sp.]